ncbi:MULTISPECIES: hypothetical protein [unclassified Pseudonocardia]|nr:hypothetical protein [Pseudonocardia sp. Ae707_Ps1]
MPLGGGVASGPGADLVVPVAAAVVMVGVVLTRRRERATRG